jgi:hypothetical protein
MLLPAAVAAALALRYVAGIRGSQCERCLCVFKLSDLSCAFLSLPPTADSAGLVFCCTVSVRAGAGGLGLLAGCFEAPLLDLLLLSRHLESVLSLDGLSFFEGCLSRLLPASARARLAGAAAFACAGSRCWSRWLLLARKRFCSAAAAACSAARRLASCATSPCAVECPRPS